MSLNGISRAAEQGRQMCLPGPSHQWDIVNHLAQGRLAAQEILQHAKPNACRNWDIQSLSPPCCSPPPHSLLLSSLPINKTFHYQVMKIKIRQVSHPPWYYSALSSASSSSSTHLQPWRLKKIHHCGSQSEDGATCIPVGNRAKTAAFWSAWSWELHCCTDFKPGDFMHLQSHFSPPDAEHLLEEHNRSHCFYFSQVGMKDGISTGIFFRWLIVGCDEMATLSSFMRITGTEGSKKKSTVFLSLSAKSACTHKTPRDGENLHQMISITRTPTSMSEVLRD